MRPQSGASGVANLETQIDSGKCAPAKGRAALVHRGDSRAQISEPPLSIAPLSLVALSLAGRRERRRGREQGNRRRLMPDFQATASPAQRHQSGGKERILEGRARLADFRRLFGPTRAGTKSFFCPFGRRSLARPSRQAKFAAQ